MRCVDLYNQSQSKWFEEMVTTSLVRKSAFQLHDIFKLITTITLIPVGLSVSV